MSVHTTRVTEGSYFGSVITIGVLFFIFGFVTWLNGPMITFVKLAFTLDDVNAFLVPMAFYLSYFFLALPASAVLRRTGMKNGMALGLFVMAIGATLFGQFTTMRQYPGVLTGLFVIGAGLSLLQTASNPYISIIGPIDSAAQRIAFMGICSKFAGFLAPFVFGALVLRDLDNFDLQVKAAPTIAARDVLLDAFAAQVHLPYMIMAALLALLAIWMARSALPEIKPDAANDEHMIGHTDGSIFSFPHLWLGVLCLFLYVGVEVMAGDAIVIYGEDFKLPLSATRLFTSFTLFAMMIGYVAGLLLIPRFVSQSRYLAISAVMGVLLTVGAYLTSGYRFRGIRRRVRLRQRDDVAGDLPAGDQRPRATHRGRLGPVDHGNRRWCRDPLRFRRAQTALRLSARVHGSLRTELPLHFLLRRSRPSAGAESKALTRNQPAALAVYLSGIRFTEFTL